MGTVEEGGKVAVSIVDSLKSQPVSLAILVMNVIFLVFIFWVLREIQASRKEEMATMKQAINANRDILIELQRTCVRFEPRSSLENKGQL